MACLWRVRELEGLWWLCILGQYWYQKWVVTMVILKKACCHFLRLTLILSGSWTGSRWYIQTGWLGRVWYKMGSIKGNSKWWGSTVVLVLYCWRCPETAVASGRGTQPTKGPGGEGTRKIIPLLSYNVLKAEGKNPTGSCRDPSVANEGQSPREQGQVKMSEELI